MINIILNTLLLALYLVYCYKYLKELQLYVIPFFYLFLIQFWIVLSVYALDYGGLYIYELRTTSEKSFATTFLILGNMVFFHSLKSYLDKREYKNKKNITGIHKFDLKKFQVISLVLFLIICSYYLVFGLVGVPFLMGMDRATFSEIMNGIPGIGILWRNILFVSFLIGYSYAVCKKNGKSIFFPILQFGLVVLFLVLAGNRFSAIFSVVTSFLIGPVLLGTIPKISFKKIVKFGTFFFIFIIGTTLLHSSTYSYSADILGEGEFLGYLFERIFILQGEIWWKTFDTVMVQNNFDSNHIWVELRNIVGLSPGGYTGLRYLMVEAANGSFIYDIIEGEYLYTGAFPAIILATFNWPLFFVALYILGKIFGVVVLCLQRYLITGSLIMVYLIYIIYSTFNTMIITGGFEGFFITTNLFRIFLLVTVMILIYTNRKSKLNHRNEIKDTIANSL